MSRPPPVTGFRAALGVLGDVALAALLVLVIPLALIIIGAPIVVLGWALSALEGLF